MANTPVATASGPGLTWSAPSHWKAKPASAMRKGSFVIQPVTVNVRFGPPVESAGVTLDDRDRLAAAVRERIEGLLREG